MVTVAVEVLVVIAVAAGSAAWSSLATAVLDNGWFVVVCVMAGSALDVGDVERVPARLGKCEHEAFNDPSDKLTGSASGSRSLSWERIRRGSKPKRSPALSQQVRARCLHKARTISQRIGGTVSVLNTRAQSQPHEDYRINASRKPIPSVG